jgi:hypothetical protein
LSSAKPPGEVTRYGIADQVRPPLLVNTPGPANETAQHEASVRQVTLYNSLVPTGRLRRTQLTPSLVVKAVPGVVALVVPPPVARQCVVSGQEIESNPPRVAVGKVDAVQVKPPFVVFSTTESLFAAPPAA